MSEHKIKREKSQAEKDRWAYLKQDLLKLKGTKRRLKPRLFTKKTKKAVL